MDGILSRLRKFNPTALSYEPEIQRLTLAAHPNDHPDSIAMEVQMVMDFMRGHLPVLTFAKLNGPQKYRKTCYGRDRESGRRYRYYPTRRKQVVYIDAEPQPVEAAQAA